MSEECPESGGSNRCHVERGFSLGAEQRAMKKSGVRRGVLVYKGPDPEAKMKIQDLAPREASSAMFRRIRQYQRTVMS